MKISFCVLYTALYVSVGCIISGPVNETITTPAGGAVLLPCSCTDLQAKPEEFLWSFTGFTNDSLYLEVIGNWHEAEKKRYSGRVQIFNVSAPGNASLLLSDLTEEDQGEYTCHIFTKQDTSARLITLIVKESSSRSVWILLLVLLMVLGAFGVIYWRYRKWTHDPAESREENSEQTQQQNQYVVYATVVKRSSARPAPTDTNTQETTEDSSEAMYATVVKKSSARPAARDTNTQESTEDSREATYATVIKRSSARPAPRDTNSQETMEDCSIRADGV